jgi:tetratricopeptide (TPR) repeat protein
VTDIGPAEARAQLAHPRLIGNVPYRNTYFTGRATELRMLRELLEDSQAGIMPIYGLGGIGKSEIATEYVYRHGADYSLCCWIPSEKPQLIQNALLTLGRALRLAEVRPDERDRSVEIVLDALRQGRPVADWLLVFDNAPEAAAVVPFIPRGPGHVIITSRDSHWSKALGVDGIEIGEWQHEETVEYLRRRVPALAPVTDNPGASTQDLREEEARQADSRELADAIEDLPIAADHAQAYLRQTASSVKEYIDMLRGNAHILMAYDVDIKYPGVVASTWSVSRAALSAEAVALFTLLAFFAPEPVHEELLVQPGKLQDLPFPSSEESARGAALRHVLADSRQFRDAARELQRFSLAKMDGRRNVIQVHRVVRAVTQGEITRSDKEAADEFRAVVHSLLAATDPNAPDRDDTDKDYALSRPHIEPSGALESPNPLVRHLIINQVKHLYRMGGYTESLAIGEAALAKWREIFEPSDELTLSLAVEIAPALRHVGRWKEAMSLDSATMSELQSLHKSEDSETYLLCARSYGVDLLGLGQYANALANDEPLVLRYEHIFGPEHPETLQMRNNVAISLRCLGRFSDALQYDRKTLEVRERLLGSNDTATLTSRFAVARSERRMGRWDEALRDIQGVANALEEKGEPWDQFRMLVASDLGVSLRRVGYWEEAAQEGESVLARHRETFGDDHRDTLRTAINVINDRRIVGNVRGAIELGEQTVAALEKVVGADHPNTIAARANLAIALRVSGNPRAARELNEQALSDFLAMFGEEHPSSLVVMTNLASDLAAMGEVKLARQHGERSLTVHRRFRGDNNPFTLATGENLSLDRRADGDAEGAEELHREVVKRYRDTLGPEHPDSRLAAQYGRANIDIEPMMD